VVGALGFVCLVIGWSWRGFGREDQSRRFRAGVSLVCNRGATNEDLSSSSEFVPVGERPPRLSAYVRIDKELEMCEIDSSPGKKFQSLIDEAWFHGKKPMKLSEFVCQLKCKADEAELEETFRMHGASKYTVPYLKALCAEGSATALIWVNDGVPKYFVCAEKDHVQGRALFHSTKAILSILLKLVELPDVLFALDTRDWAVPEGGNPRVPGWLYPIPGMARYTGTISHPSVLMPTDAFIRATMHCKIGSQLSKSFTHVCKQIDSSPKAVNTPWSSRRDVIVWRGSSTGVPLDPVIVDYLPRPALMKKFASEPGFDLGFTGGPPPARAKGYGDFFKLKSQPSIPSEEFTQFKHILHMDGHTASWGLAQKLTTKSAIIWVGSNFRYREFYYVHLKPWEHYIPADSDLSNLRHIRDWTRTTLGDFHSNRMAERAAQLVDTRLRPQDTYCYLARMMLSFAKSQQEASTRNALIEGGLRPDLFVKFEEFD